MLIKWHFDWFSNRGTVKWRVMHARAGKARSRWATRALCAHRISVFIARMLAYLTQIAFGHLFLHCGFG